MFTIQKDIHNTQGDYMSFFLLNILLITWTALICLSFVRKLRRSEGLSTRAMLTLFCFGSLSWVLQMMFLWNMTDSALESTFIVTLIAMFCCTILLYGHYNATFSTSATAQALLWGIFVFPAVLLIIILISLLPEGIATLATALGLK
jgi:hypothetical protein